MSETVATSFFQILQGSGYGASRHQHFHNTDSVHMRWHFKQCKKKKLQNIGLIFSRLCRIHRCSLTHHIRFLRPSQLLEIHIYKIYILLQCCWIATARTGTALLMVYKRFHGDVFPHAICPDEKKLVWTLLQRQLWSFSLLVCIYLHIWHKYFQNHRVNSKLFEHIIQNTSLHIDLPT